eukprot:scaffold19994_cov129-Isochrysis_galbana.AAC.3
MAMAAHGTVRMAANSITWHSCNHQPRSSSERALRDTATAPMTAPCPGPHLPHPNRSTTTCALAPLTSCLSLVPSSLLPRPPSSHPHPYPLLSSLCRRPFPSPCCEVYYRSGGATQRPSGSRMRGTLQASCHWS